MMEFLKTHSEEEIIRAASRRAANPDPLSLDPAVFGTVSKWAPMITGTSPAVPQFSPGIMPMTLFPSMSMPYFINIFHSFKKTILTLNLLVGHFFYILTV